MSKSKPSFLDDISMVQHNNGNEAVLLWRVLMSLVGPQWWPKQSVVFLFIGDVIACGAVFMVLGAALSPGTHPKQ